MIISVPVSFSSILISVWMSLSVKWKITICSVCQSLSVPVLVCLACMCASARERERRREREMERQKDGLLAFKWADGTEPISLTLCLSFFSLWHFSPSSPLRVISPSAFTCCLPHTVTWRDLHLVPFVILKKKWDLQKDKRKNNTYSYRMIHRAEETNGTFLKEQWWYSRSWVMNFMYWFFFFSSFSRWKWTFFQMNSSLQGSPSLSGNLS